MNPWDIFAWVGAVSLSVVVAACAIAFTRNLIGSAWDNKKHDIPKDIWRGGEND